MNLNLRIVLIFFLLLAGLNGAYQLEKRVSGRFIDRPYTRLVTASAGRLGNLILPFSITAPDAITLRGERAAVIIRSGCNGLEAVFLLLAGVLAYPAAWKQRGRALLIYLPALFGLNLLRVVGLLYVFDRYPDQIDLFHDQIAQGILVLFVFGFWMQYVNRAQT